MRAGMLFHRLGALGLVLTVGIFFEVSEELRENPYFWSGTLVLVGFPVVCGLFLLGVKQSLILGKDRGLMLWAHGAALLSVFWLLAWCMLWLVMMGMSYNAEMLIKHTSYLHLFGVGFSMAGYTTGWMTPPGGRSVRFMMTVGWAVSYTAWFNLYFQPGLRWFWAPAIGGLSLVLGAFLMERALKREVEATSPRA